MDSDFYFFSGGVPQEEAPFDNSDKDENVLNVTKISGFKTSLNYFEGKSDLEIWRMFISGHEGAFQYIYSTYIDDLFRYGSHITTDREILKDAIHDLFVELRNNHSKTDSIRFYLLKALRWKILRLLKNQKNRLDRNKLFAQFNAVIEISYEEKMIFNQITEQQLKKLAQGIKGLTRRQTEALYHFYYEDMNYKEVARIMKLTSIKSARNIIYKSIKQLKNFFKS